MFLAVLSALASAQSLPKQPYDFSFDAVDGAGGYLVEVQDPTGKPVVSQKLGSGQTDVSLNLIPGPYQLRLSTLNKFGRVESSTEWASVHVDALVAPALVSMEPQTLQTGPRQTLILKANRLAPDLKVTLTGPDDVAVPALEVEHAPDGTVKAQFSGLTKTGAFLVTLTNPPGQNLRISGKVIVHYPLPAVTKLEPLTLGPSDPSRTLTVSGSQFSSEALVWLQQAGDSPVPLSVSSRSSVGLTAKVPELAPGDWQVAVSNGADEKTTEVGTLTITAPTRNVPLLEVMKETGTVFVSSFQDGELSMDEVDLGPLPQGSSLVRKVEVGSHTMTLTYADGTTEAVGLEITKASTAEVTFSEGGTFLKFDRIPDGFTATVNDVPVEAKNLKGVALKIDKGKYQVKVSTSSGQSWVQNCEVSAGTTFVQFENMIALVPQHTVHFTGSADDWFGLIPVVEYKGDLGNLPNANLVVKAIWLSRDKDNLYIRFDLLNGTPLARNGTTYVLSEQGYPGGGTDPQVDYNGGSFSSMIYDGRRKVPYRVGSFALMKSGIEMRFPLDTLASLGIVENKPFPFRPWVAINNANGLANTQIIPQILGRRVFVLEPLQK